jgi:hypothetical protein
MVPRLRGELAALLASLPASDWARTTVDGALRRYIRDPSAPPLTWHGDPEIAGALALVKAILG